MIAIQFLSLILIISFLTWLKWPFKFDFMFGPLNIPTLIVSIILLSLILLFPKPTNR